MNTDTLVVACLLLVCGVVSSNGESTTFQSTNDSETYSTVFENLSTETVDIDFETTVEPETLSTTDFDTHGDIIITTNSDDEAGSSHSLDDVSTLVEWNTTETSTDIFPTTSAETTTTKATWRACAFNLCKNGGKCMEDLSDPNLYTCNCTHGYIGTHCQVSDRCFADEDGNICIDGACVYEKNGLSRVCTCFFGMFWDADAKKCKKPDPPCFPNPCHNGTCLPDEGSFHCSCESGFEGSTCDVRNLCGQEDDCGDGTCEEDLEKKLKLCKCRSKFYWDEDKRKCEAIESPCTPNPCKNRGLCNVHASSQDFNCSCTEDYVGHQCEIRNFCNVSKSDGDLSCDHGVCVDSDSSKMCRCDEGYYLDQESYTCREIIKPCLPNPCLNDGKCIPVTQDAYNCTCSDGYSGLRCTEDDYCVLEGGNSFCGDAECRSDHALGIFYCSCGLGQYFDYELRGCFDLDFCPLMSCNENEECKNNTCHCKENYKRDNSTGDCEPHFCPSNPCPEDLVCVEGDGIDSYQCGCEKGYAFDGKRCNAGAICIFPDMNSCDQCCMPEENGYLCSCEDDFVLNPDNRTCEYIGNLACTNKTCNNGICLRREENEKCICGPGFVEVDGNCVDLCTAGQVPEGYCPDNKCQVTDSGFKCQCEGKYAYANDDITCKVRKTCDEGEIGWRTCSQRHALCREEWSATQGFECHCMEGQVATEGGFCRDVCSIEENQKHCSGYGAECDVTEGGATTCKCPPYFLPFENGTACGKPAMNSFLMTIPLNPSSYKRSERSRRSTDLKYADVDYHSVEQDVRKAMKNLFPALLYSNVLNCRENEDFIKCKVELQFSSIKDEDLKRLRLPEVCRAGEGVSSACLVPPSLVLEKAHLNTVMSIHRTDPCDADIKEDLCGSETFCTSVPDESIIKCRCEAGFSIRSIRYPYGSSESFIENCKDIDECAIAYPCQENMNCHNTLGSFTCSCQPGYRTKDLSKPETSGCVEICTPSPCVHGDCMEIGDHNFECKCSPGYNGLLCDLQDENFKHARTNTIIVGAVLGGCLLIVIILSVANISRLKKKKDMLQNSESMLYGSEMTERRGGEAGAINNAYQRD